MNKAILNIVNQEFINSNLNTDIASLLLKGTSFIDVDTKAVIEQIEAKKKCKAKLPTWFRTPLIYYPNKLNIEQTSSEITAQYKSCLITGKTLIDLTGGFGVDCYYFSKYFKEVTHCEMNSKLSDIVTHNYNQLQVSNIDTFQTNGLEYIRSASNSFDWIYIDPSRRHDSKGKVFYLKDCLPNVSGNLDLLFKYSKNILIKASPMLDISVGLSELKYAKEIHIVAIKNDVKELLFKLEKGYKEDIKVKTINIKPETNEVFDFYLNEELVANATFSEPLDYLYEPNASILKSGAFNNLSYRLKVDKIHKHSHLYTSNELIDFPGRRFKIQNIFVYNKKEVSKYLRKTKANITVRNFPESVGELRKKYKIKDGGELYVFFTTDCNNRKTVIICNKL